ncbi:MAG: competence/damage-inducible protein A [Anaerolineae bacterium]
MTDNVTVEIIAVGTEILLGEITDTNSVYLARQLRDLGINIYYMTTVGDNRQRIADAIRQAMSRADVIITSGGLGPTVDDMTRQSVADATERDLTFRQELYDQILTRFSSYKVTMTPNNARQAYLPANAITIENPVGTAPSFIVEHQGKSIISLPGVPRELKYLFETRIIDYLRARYQLGIIKARLLKTAGIGESTLDDMLGDALLNATNPSIGLAAHHGIIDIRITAKAEDEAQADQMLDVFETRVWDRVGTYIFGIDDDILEHVLCNLLTVHNGRIAIIEAGIQDAIIEKLTNAGFEQVIEQAIQFDHPYAITDAYPDTANLSLRETAHHLARTIATGEGVEAGIALLSLPDVDENQDTEVATVVAVYTNNEIKSRVYGFGALNPLTSEWVSRWAMAYLWQQLKVQFDAS